MAEMGVAIIGCGDQGLIHARSFREAGCAPLFLYDIDRSKAEALAVALGEGKVVDSSMQAVRMPEVKIAAIASYDDAHASQVLQALFWGKHIFCEKPLAYSLNELQQIKRALSAPGPLDMSPYLRLAVNLPLRAAPAFRWLKHNTGKLGAIYEFSADYWYGRVKKLTEGWRKDVQNYSCMLGAGIHLIDLMLWVTGERPIRVSAVGNKIATRDTAFKYTDFVAATFEFPSGLIGRISVNMGAQHSHFHAVRVFGTQGAFIRDGSGQWFIQEGSSHGIPFFARESLNLPPFSENDGVLIANFVASFQSKIPSGSDILTESFDATACCLAADKAMRTENKEEIVNV